MAQKKAKANILIVNFKVPSEAYQAFTELRQEPVDDFYAIGQAAIVKNEKGKFFVKDAFDSGSEAWSAFWADRSASCSAAASARCSAGPRIPTTR